MLRIECERPPAARPRAVEGAEQAVGALVPAMVVQPAILAVAAERLVVPFVDQPIEVARRVVRGVAGRPAATPLQGFDHRPHLCVVPPEPAGGGAGGQVVDAVAQGDDQRRVAARACAPGR